MKVLLFTEGGKEGGFGHLMRVVSLWEAFTEKSITPILYVNGDSSVVDILREIEHKRVNWIDQFNEISDELQDTEIAVIDSYKTPCELYQKIANRVKLPVFIDDYQRIKYPRGIILNCNLYAENLVYPKVEDQQVLKGSSYSLLRKEFWEVQEKPMREKVESILVTMGGSDIRNLTMPVLNVVQNMMKDLRLDVIISNAFSDTFEKKRNFLENVDVHYNSTTREIKEIMMDSDLAISGGGQTLLELAGIGVPTIVIGIVDNQKLIIESLKNESVFDFAGWYDEGQLFEKLTSNLNRLRNSGIRKQRSQQLRKLVDGKGSLRVVDFLMKFHGNIVS